MFRSSDDRRRAQPNVSVDGLSRRVDVLAERVDTLAQTVATTAAAIAKKDGELVVLRRDFEASRAQAEAALASARPTATDELGQLKAAVTALASERARSSDESRIGRLEQQVALLAERVDTLATTVAATAAGLAGRDGDLVALRRRLEQVTSGPGGGPAVGDSFRSRIDDLGAATASTSVRLEGQSEQITSLGDAVTALGERLDRADRERTSLAATVAEAAAVRWRDLERPLADLVARLDVIEQERARSDAALSRATALWPAALSSLEARVDELAGASGRELPHARPASPPSLPSARAADVGRFLGEIRALERRLEEFESQVRHERDELGARLRRVEAGGHEPREPEPIGADVLPFPGPET